MRRYLGYVCAAVALCGLQAGVAHADTLDLFTFSLNGVPGTGTATINASPSPSSDILGTSFTLNNVTASYLGSTFTSNVTFFDAGGAGTNGNNFGGDKLYTGLDSGPTFRTGNFSLQGIADLGDGPQALTGSLNISSLPASVTPEPGSLALVGTAALGFAGIVRRRCL